MAVIPASLPVALTVIPLWAFHAVYLSSLFENVRFFSHLSDVEREMTYRTEMGLYFSYYKTIIFAPTFWNGVDQLLSDNVTEFGSTINTLKRFNLYPELTISAAFRVYKGLAKYFGWKDQECWSVNRGGGLPPVESCEGIGNHHYFYVYSVFFIAGTVLPSLFLGGTILGGYLGGVLTTAAFMFNHGEATRVQWTPPLRESFAYPMLIAQVVVLSCILKHGKTNVLYSALLVTSTVAFCVCWQLSQFVIGTQLGSLVLLYSFELFSPALLLLLWKHFAMAFCLSLALLFGNPMLLNSLFSTSLLSIALLLFLRPIFDRLSFRPLFIFAHCLFHTVCAVGLKLALQWTLNLTDDNNVVELLRAKFSDFHTFHTRLYTCAPEFDFLPFETIRKLVLTWLLPIAAFAVLLLVNAFLRSEVFGGRWRTRKPMTNQRVRGGEYCECAFHLCQLCCFVGMALLVMRLKLFATPQLCLMCALVANRQLLALFAGDRIARLRIVLVALLLAGMANQGWENVRGQFAMRGEYNNPEQEKLFLWIQHNTRKDAAFAGTMALMANIKLSTLRPIVNHPHYESEEIRNRTLEVYSMYSRRTLEQVFASLRSLGTHFFVFQPQQCVDAHPRTECTYLAMWDEMEPENAHRPSLCHHIWTAVQQGGDPRAILPFSVKYQSEDYVVLGLSN